MVTKGYNGPIPFDSYFYGPQDHGKLILYYRGKPDSTMIEWIGNFEFQDTITIINFSRGQSASNFICKDSKNNEYQIFMKDMLDIILHVNIKKGKIHGNWTFVKRGCNYGIALITEE